MAFYFLFKCQWQIESRYRHSMLPDDYLLAPSLNDYTTNVLVYDWVHFFHDQTKDRVVRSEYRLLLMDNDGSHSTELPPDLRATSQHEQRVCTVGRKRQRENRFPLPDSRYLCTSI